MLYEALESICKVLTKELSKVVEKLESSGSVISPSDVEYVNNLTHAIKSVETTKAMLSAEGEGSYDDGMSRNDGYSNRGRGRYARRDSNGRYASDGYSERYSRNGYSREGYSRNNEMVSELRNLMEDAPDENTKMEFKKFITKIESM